MSILLVGLVLSFAWASTIAIPVNNYTKMEVDGKTILGSGDKVTKNYIENTFLSGVIYGYTKYKEIKAILSRGYKDIQPIPFTASDAERYKPIFKYDGQAHKNCFPDRATSSNNGQCRTTLNQNTPIYYQTTTCSGTTVYTYWHWYGWQNNCCCGTGAHDDDWEHVSVYVRNN